MMKSYFRKFFQYKNLLYELVKKGIKLKYRKSYLGMLWSLIEPLLTMIVLSIVFGTLLGTRTKEFNVYILTGRLLYNFFAQGTKGGLKSIRANSGMIKKVYVPKYLYPMSAMLFNYILFLISLIVLFAVSIVVGIYPTIYLLQAIPVLLNVLLLTYGVGIILSTVGVFFRDMEYLWNVVLMLIMYTCAIFYYPEKILDSKYGWIIEFNPVFCVIQNFRSAVFGEMMNIKYFVYTFIFGVAASVIGMYVFYKKQDDFILYI